MIKFGYNDPKAMGLASAAGLATWKASGFSVDPSHISEVVLAALAGGSASSNMTNKPNVSAESHIITPYVNNLEGDQE